MGEGERRNRNRDFWVVYSTECISVLAIISTLKRDDVIDRAICGRKNKAMRRTSRRNGLDLRIVERGTATDIEREASGTHDFHFSWVKPPQIFECLSGQ
jgi:hypothetical protein